LIYIPLNHAKQIDIKLFQTVTTSQNSKFHLLYQSKIIKDPNYSTTFSSTPSTPNNEYIAFVETFRIWVSEVSYEGYKSDEIVVGQTISFVNIISNPPLQLS